MKSRQHSMYSDMCHFSIHFLHFSHFLAFFRFFCWTNAEYVGVYTKVLHIDYNLSMRLHVMACFHAETQKKNNWIENIVNQISIFKLKSNQNQNLTLLSLAKRSTPDTSKTSTAASSPAMAAWCSDEYDVSDFECLSSSEFLFCEELFSISIEEKNTKSKKYLL